MQRKNRNFAVYRLAEIASNMNHPRHTYMSLVTYDPVTSHAHATQKPKLCSVPTG